MPHDLERISQDAMSATRARSQIEFPDSMPDLLEQGLLIWPSDRDFWSEEPLRLDLANPEQAGPRGSLKFQITDLRIGDRVRLTTCGLVCRFLRESRLWQFDISFETGSEPSFVRDALGAVEGLQINQKRFTLFAENFGLIEVTPSPDSVEMGAHVFFP